MEELKILIVMLVGISVGCVGFVILLGWVLRTPLNSPNYSLKQNPSEMREFTDALGNKYKAIRPKCGNSNCEESNPTFESVLSIYCLVCQEKHLNGQLWRSKKKI